MPDEKLTFAQVCLLVTLMGEAREVPNAYLTNVRKISLKKEYRDRLEAQKLITVRTAGRGISLDLTDKGWSRAFAEFGGEAPPGAGSGGAALYTMLESIRRFLDRSDMAAAEFFAQVPDLDIEARIRKAYEEIARVPREMVSLAALRARLGSAPRHEVDAVLVQLSSAPDVRIIPESNQKTLTEAQRAAAVSIGNQDKHLIAIGV